MTQLTFHLAPVEPYSLSYFVPHSGVTEAYELLEHAIAEVSEGGFRLVFLYGSSGTGKTHLLYGFRKRAEEQGIDPERICVCSLEQLLKNKSESIGEFVKTYDRLKSEGGLILVEARDIFHPTDDLDKHLSSRLLAGYSVKVGYPREEELRPLLLSLLERKNLKLTDYSLNYLLRWLPLDPLSLDRILTAINDLSLSNSRKVGQGLIREVLRAR